MSLTVSSFLTYSGYTSENVNIDYLTRLLDTISEIIEEELGTLFTLVEINSVNPDPMFRYIDVPGHNLDFIRIGAWQATGLNISIGTYGTQVPSLTNLVLNRDYTLKYYQDRALPGHANPVVAIRLIGNQYGGYYSGWYGGSNKLDAESFLRITGTLGWSNGLPKRLEDLIYEIVKTKLERNQNMTQSGGKGVANSEKSVRLTFSYSSGSEDLNKARSLAFDIMGDPDVAKALNRYKQYTFKTATIS
jgi:hypothetical protein